MKEGERKGKKKTVDERLKRGMKRQKEGRERAERVMKGEKGRKHGSSE